MALTWADKRTGFACMCFSVDGDRVVYKSLCK